MVVVAVKEGRRSKGIDGTSNNKTVAWSFFACMVHSAWAHSAWASVQQCPVMVATGCGGRRLLSRSKEIIVGGIEWLITIALSDGWKVSQTKGKSRTMGSTLGGDGEGRRRHRQHGHGRLEGIGIGSMGGTGLAEPGVDWGGGWHWLMGLAGVWKLGAIG